MRSSNPAFNYIHALCLHHIIHCAAYSDSTKAPKRDKNRSKHCFFHIDEFFDTPEQLSLSTDCARFWCPCHKLNDQ